MVYYSVMIELRPLVATPATNGLDTRYQFAFGVHIPEYAPQLAAQLAGSAVLAFECVGGSAAQRTLLAERCNILADPQAPQAAKDRIAKSNYFKGVEYITAIVRRFAHTGVRVELLDIGKDHPAWAIYCENERASARFYTDLSCHAPNDVLRQSGLHALERRTISNQHRDPVIASQLIAFADPVGPPPDIVGVAAGEGHTAVQSIVGAAGFATTGAYAGVDLVSYRRQADMQLRATGKVAAPLLERIILQSILDSFELCRADGTPYEPYYAHLLKFGDEL